jgi:hypothetical protein
VVERSLQSGGNSILRILRHKIESALTVFLENLGELPRRVGGKTELVNLES